MSSKADLSVLIRGEISRKPDFDLESLPAYCFPKGVDRTKREPPPESPGPEWPHQMVHLLHRELKKPGSTNDPRPAEPKPPADDPSGDEEETQPDLQPDLSDTEFDLLVKRALRLISRLRYYKVSEADISHLNDSTLHEMRHGTDLTELRNELERQVEEHCPIPGKRKVQTLVDMLKVCCSDEAIPVEIASLDYGSTSQLRRKEVDEAIRIVGPVFRALKERQRPRQPNKNGGSNVRKEGNGAAGSQSDPPKKDGEVAQPATKPPETVEAPDSTVGDQVNQPTTLEQTKPTISEIIAGLEGRVETLEQAPRPKSGRRLVIILALNAVLIITLVVVGGIFAANEFFGSSGSSIELEDYSSIYDE